MLRQVTSWLALIGCLAAAPALGVEPSAGDEDAHTIELPAKYATYTFGGGGRYLIFRFDTLGTVGILDVTARKIVREIDGISPGDLLAANATHLFIVMPGKMLIQRWSLDKLERERMVPIESGQTPRGVVTGATGGGPLVLLGPQAQLIEPDTLRIRKVTGDGVIGGIDRYGYAICASANGLVYGGIPTGYGAVAHQLMKVHGDRTVVHKFGSTSQAIRWAQPSADGHLVFTPGPGIYDAFGRPLSADWLAGRLLFPTFDRRYFIALRYVDDPRQVALEVGTAAERRIVYTETGFEELLARHVNSWHDIVNATKSGREPRLQWLVDRKVLVTLPATNDRVIVRTWDVMSLLKKSGEDYLWIDSLPPYTAYKGEKLRYPVRVVSRLKKLTYRLEDGPQGMSISNRGQVQWDVPESFAAATAPVIITVTDSGGNEVIHSFQLDVAEKMVPVKAE